MAQKDGAPREEAGEIEKESETKQLDRKWQGRFDKLLQEKKELETKLTERDESSNAASERQKELDRRERILNLSLERGIDPSQAMSILFGENDEDRLDAINGMVQNATDERVQEEIDKRFPKDKRPPQAGRLETTIPSWEEVTSMPEGRLQQLPQGTIARAAEQARSDKGGTVRDRLSRMIKGGGQ